MHPPSFGPLLEVVTVPERANMSTVTDLNTCELDVSHPALAMLVARASTSSRSSPRQEVWEAAQDSRSVRRIFFETISRQGLRKLREGDQGPTRVPPAKGAHQLTGLSTASQPSHGVPLWLDGGQFGSQSVGQYRHFEAQGCRHWFGSRRPLESLNVSFQIEGLLQELIVAEALRGPSSSPPMTGKPSCRSWDTATHHACQQGASPVELCASI